LPLRGSTAWCSQSRLRRHYHEPARLDALRSTHSQIGGASFSAEWWRTSGRLLVGMIWSGRFASMQRAGLADCRAFDGVCSTTNLISGRMNGTGIVDSASRAQRKWGPDDLGLFKGPGCKIVTIMLFFARSGLRDMDKMWACGARIVGAEFGCVLVGGSLDDLYERVGQRPSDP
jgi:hypothetical protein